MKRNYAALAACLTLGFSTSPARAGYLDDWAYSTTSKAYSYAAMAYQQNPSPDNYYEVYNDYYALYYLYYGGLYDNDTFRYYGYLYAANGYSYAVKEQSKNPDYSTDFGKNTYAAYYYSYLGYIFSYYAYKDPFGF